MSKLPEHLTKGGPGDKFLGDGKVDTSKWFEDPGVDVGTLEEQIKNQDIFFCAAPFQLLYTNIQGDYAPCSWAETREFGTSIKNTSIKDWFESDPKLNKLRNEMLTPGSDLQLTKKSCKSCIKQEKQYGRSRRQASLKIQSNNDFLWPEMRKAVEAYKETMQGHIKHRIFEIQIKAFGNQCNLDCYMCHPFDSTTRIKTMDSNELKDQNIFNTGEKYNMGGWRSDEYKTKMADMKNKSMKDVIEQVKDVAPYIYNLKLIGGEPLVMKQYYKLLDAIVESGYSKQMYVKFQTNMSVLGHGKYKITDYTKHFKIFELTVSLDGIGKTNNYIRRRSDWDETVKNIKEIKKYPNVQINVNGAVSFLSVMRFYELIEWFDNYKELFVDNSSKLASKFGQINWSNIRGPAKLCANVLPEEIKKELIPKYANFPDIQNVLKEDNNGLDYKDTIRYLLNVDKYYKGTKWEMNLFDVFPELKKYYE
tara:strand:- start:454 stop:1884 length:1431 start_codon:yes stop_codon:yes gene_type:complete